MSSAPTLLHKNSKLQLLHEHKGIQLPLLEMSDPYYPHSKLAKSIFSGYYILFFMYSIIFMTTYPILNFFEGKDLFGITVIKLVETNILWDCISATLFIFMAFVFTQVSGIVRRNGSYFLIGVVIATFITSGVFITKTYKMYFTDRIFIIVLDCALCVKTITYILDKKHQKQFHPSTIEWTKLQKQKKLQKLPKRFVYFISPFPSYQRFVIEHTPSLKIHINYLISKFFVTFLCVLVNNILIVKFIEPACRNDLSFIALIFKLVPLTFYINMVMYYMVMDNVIAALAEITQIKGRMFYLDWWNAENVEQFLQRWCLIINMGMQSLFPKITGAFRNVIHVITLQILLLTIFGQSLNILTCLGFIVILFIVYFLSYLKGIQNNMIVHMLTMSYTPVMIALEVKYSIFSQGLQ